MKKELLVAALENGTVIDHIPSKQLFKVVTLLGLESISNHITIGNNLASKTDGTKGIIKIADRYFKEEEVNRIALIAPNAIINTIKGYEVVEKKHLEIPETIEGIVRCVNPKCITNNEPMATRFTLKSQDPLLLKCCYCGRSFDANDIVIINN